MPWDIPPRHISVHFRTIWQPLKKHLKRYLGDIWWYLGDIWVNLGAFWDKMATFKEASEKKDFHSTGGINLLYIVCRRWLHTLWYPIIPITVPLSRFVGRVFVCIWVFTYLCICLCCMYMFVYLYIFVFGSTFTAHALVSNYPNHIINHISWLVFVDFHICIFLCFQLSQ